MGISAVSHCQACQAIVNTQWLACLVCNAPLTKPEAAGQSARASKDQAAPPKFSPGQHVLITDNLNRVRAGVIQFADWIDGPLTAKGWWYVVLDVYGLLSETHESRLRKGR